MIRTLKRFISTALVALLLLDWPLLSAYAEHAKTDREWRVGKLRQLRSEVPYRDVTENIRTFDSSKKDAAVRTVKRSLSSESRLRLRFRSSDGLDVVRVKLSESDSSATVKKLTGDSYELSVSRDSDLATEFLPEASEGKLPEKLPGWYEVIEPTLVETMSSTDFLIWERTDELWWQTYVRADAVQEVLAGFPKTRIGVVDSGVDVSHPDLVGRVDSVDGYDFVENDSDPQDANGHGTFVSGIIAGAVNGSGIYGVDSNAEIVSLKILDADGVGTTYDLADAISFAVTKGIKIVNVSLGGYGDPATDPVCQAVSAAKAAGTVVIAAAGNSNSDVSNVVPAGCADAVAVGAVGKDGSKALFSNFGAKIAVSAPGVGILSSWKDGGYETRDGTSASSAFVAGAVGAMLSKDSSKTPDGVILALKSESEGILDVASLLSAVPAPAVEPAGLTEPTVTSGTSSGTTDSGTGYYSGGTSSTWTSVGGSGSVSWSGYSFPSPPSGTVSALTTGPEWIVGEWLLAGDANDTSGNGYGWSASDVSYSTDPSGSQYAVFNWYSSRIDTAAPWLVNDFTVSAWTTRRKGGDTDGLVFSMYNSWMTVSGDWHAWACYFDGGWDRCFSSAIAVVNDDDLHHVVWTKSSTEGQALWVDGQLVGTQPSTSSLSPYYAPNPGIWYFRTFSSNYNNAGIKGVRLYNRVLSESQIHADFQGWVGGMAAEYRLNGNTDDSSWFGNHGTWIDMSWPAGMNWSLAGGFNGISSMVTAPNSLALRPMRGLTVSSWVKLSSDVTGNGLATVLANESPASGYAITVHGSSYYNSMNNKVWFFVGDGQSIHNTLATAPIVKDKWSHLVWTYDWTTVSLYVDGALASSVPFSGDVSYDPSKNFTIWESSGFPWRFFPGLIRSVKMYRRALSQSEIQADYRYGMTGLAAEYLFSANANDSSGNGNDGVAHDVSWDGQQGGSFNGHSSYVEIPDSPSVRISGDISISFRYSWDGGNPGGYNDWAAVVTKHDQNNLEYEILFNKAVGNFNFYRAGSLVAEWFATIAPNELANIALVHSPSSGTWKAYKNGVLVTEWNSSVYWAPSNWPVRIGRSTTRWWGGYFVGGTLRDFRIFARAISSSDVENLNNEWVTDTSSTHPYPTLSGADLSAYAGSTSNVVKSNDAIRSGNFQTSPAEGDGSRHDVANAGDPVTLSTGEFAYSNTFLKAKESPMPYEFSLTYRNQMKYAGPAGNGFDHNYNVFLVENADGSVNYYDGKLGIFNFAPTETGFARNDGLRATLSKDTAGHYFISFDGGAWKEFWPNLRISEDSDKFGNSLSFAYYSNDALSTVTDALGRNVDYEYGSDTRLSKVTDWLGRTVEFAYFPNGDLKFATLKSGTASKAVSFTYAGSTHDIATLVDAKGQVYVSNVYDSSWRVTSQTYGNGTITYSYELSGSRVASNTVTNAEGVITKYSYDSNGNVTERRVYDRIGGWSTAYRYEYYSNARLAKSVMPNGNGTTYLYDARGNVVEKRDKTDADAPDSPDDLVTYAEYDPTYGIPVRSESPDEIETTAVLDGSGNVLSRTVTGILNPDGSKYSSTVSYEYDSQGKVIKTTDPMGRETAYSYLGGLTSSVTKGTGAGAVTEAFAYGPDGNPASSADGEGKTKTFEYDALGQLAKATSSEGVETRFQYDANGNKTREEAYSSTGVLASRTDYAYDTLDKVVTKTVKTGADSSLAVHTAYDANGNVISERLGTAAEIRTAYDEMGRVKEKRVVADQSDPSEDVVTSYSYDRNGNLLSVTDPLGNVTMNVYDGFDRKIRSTDPFGNITTYAYDEAGNAVETRTYSSAQVLVSRTLFVHDGAGHVIRTVKKGDNGVPDAVMTVRYAPDGNVVETVDAMGNATAYAYDSLGRKTSVTDPLGNRAETSYDKRGLVTETRLVGSGSENAVTTRYGYDADGRKTVKKAVTSTGTFDAAYSYGTLAAPLSVTDADGNRTDFAYDLAGRKTAETRYLADGTPVTTSYGYDGNGNLASVSDAEGKSTAYSYDALRRNVRVAYPDWTHKDYEYDKAGNLVGETLARGVEISMQYDALGRPVSRAATGSWIPVPESETYSYDALGYLVSATSSGSSLGFSYDFLWRMASETQDGKTVEYGYDANGSCLSVSASGYLAEYSRDALGRIVSASLDGTGILSRSYSGAFLVSDSFWNGSRTDYSYDALGRLNSLSRPGLPSASRGYAYSPAGNVTSDGTRNYAYDPLSRLVSAGALPDSAHPAGAESFGYDKANNRTSSELAGTSASYSGNLLDQYVSATSGSGTETYSYDADGNMSTDGKFLYSYDSKNRLIGVKNPDGSFVASYSYDPLGRRTSKTTAEGRTGYLYSGENAITETFVPTGAGTPRETSNLFGDSPDELLAYSSDVSATTPEEASERLFCALRVAPYGQDFSRYGWNALVLRCAGLEDAAGVFERKTFAVLSDRLGSPVALVDGSGSTVLEYAYSAFGEAYAKSWTGNFVPVKETGILLNDSRLFAGREFDAETGLYYNRARTYSPELGRFLQRDPAWQSDQVNPYAYVGNDPLGFTDPSGEVAFLLPLVAAANSAEIASVLFNTAGVLAFVYADHGIFNGPDVFSDGGVWIFTWPDLIGVSGTEAYGNATPATGAGAVVDPSSDAYGAGAATAWNYGSGYASSPSCSTKNVMKVNKWVPKDAQKKVGKWQGPRDVERIDKPESSVPWSQWHAHDKYKGAWYNQDGSFHDKLQGIPQFGKKTIEWLNEHGWNINR